MGSLFLKQIKVLKYYLNELPEWVKIIDKQLQMKTKHEK